MFSRDPISSRSISRYQEVQDQGASRRAVTRRGLQCGESAKLRSARQHGGGIEFRRGPKHPVVARRLRFLAAERICTEVPILMRVLVRARSKPGPWKAGIVRNHAFLLLEPCWLEIDLQIARLQHDR